MSAYELAEWEAYDRIDPIGEIRGDFRMAELASLITNIALSIVGKKGTKMTNIDDFLPQWGMTESRERKGQSVEEMKAILKEIATVHNRQEERKRKRNVSSPPANLKKKKDG